MRIFPSLNRNPEGEKWKGQITKPIFSQGSKRLMVGFLFLHNNKAYEYRELRREWICERERKKQPE
jgi:hypothetical protein